MTKVRIVYKNLWKSGTLLGQCSQHPEFPGLDTQVASPLQPWRTRYGTGSGNGLFVVTDSNKYINFDEGGSELTAMLTTGSYNGATLATEIKTQLDAAGALTYTVAYDEATAKFTISAGSNFTLRWNTGTNKTADISDLCGFSDAADDTGDDEYTSDTRVIHYPRAYISVDTVNAADANFFAIIEHNISASATIKFRGADDSAFTTNVTEVTITHNAGSIFYFHGSSVSKRYWQLQVQDPTNAAGYIQVGAVVIGPYWEPTRSFGKYSRALDDPSEIDYSDSGAIFCQRRQSAKRWRLPFTALTDTDVTHVLAMMEEVGVYSGIVVCFDSGDANDNSYWVSPVDLAPADYKQFGCWSWALNVKEVL